MHVDVTDGSLEEEIMNNESKIQFLFKETLLSCIYRLSTTEDCQE